MTKRKLKPVLHGDWWLIGPSPDLRGILPGAEKWLSDWEAGAKKEEHNAPVDHHLMQDPLGTWHLWGCVRATAVGRILYHWKTDNILDTPWESTGEIIRVDRGLGESVRGKEECIQSPYFLKVDDTYHMFYGGGSTEDASETRKNAQMCLMSSTDGVNWSRYRNESGTRRLFAGPGPTRDPCVIKIGDLWHLYYAGARENDVNRPAFWCRTSEDLLIWSEPIMVHEDAQYGSQRWDTECPHVVYRNGFYYLFRTVEYNSANTHVFRSEDPLDFGVGDASDKHVCRFPVGAPELYSIADEEYVTSNHNPPLGTQMCRMKWVEQS